MSQYINPNDPNNPNNANFDPNSMIFRPDNETRHPLHAHQAHGADLVDAYAMIMIQALSRAQSGIGIQQAIDTQTTQNAASLLEKMNDYWYGQGGVLQFWASEVAKQTLGEDQTTAQTYYSQVSANANVATGQMQSTMSQGETVAGNDTTNLSNIGQVVQAMMSLFAFIASKM
jgi:hypothetical protein